MRPSSNTKGRKTPLLANQAATSYKTVDYIKKILLGHGLFGITSKASLISSGSHTRVSTDCHPMVGNYYRGSYARGTIG